MENYDFKKDIPIDEDNLDVSWIQHPMLYMKWLEYKVISFDRMEKIKNKLEVLEAKLDKFIRENSDKKLTEAAIKNEIISNEEYQTLKLEYIQAKFDYGIADAACSAFEHRKKALEKLCDLVLFGYNSEPKQNNVIKENILNNIQNKIKGGLK